ncbi:MAG: type II secretion system F family protein [Arcobacteraceae bacterium]|nr:type II secretion system F family protein [Arcobacteraceae bacterium]
MNKDGKRFLDGYDVENQEELFTILKTIGSIPLKSFIVPPSLHFLSNMFNPHINSAEVIEILDGLHMTLKAGIPLSQGLSDIAQDSTNINIKRIATRILISVMSGNSLSKSCERYKEFFTPTIINLISIGEETGKIDITLSNGAQFLRKVQDLKRNLKQALIYPLLSIVLMFGAIIAWMTLVVPQLVGFFKDVDAQLPPLTVFLIDTSEFLTEYIGSIMIFIIAIIIAFKFSFDKLKNFRMIVLKFLLKIPVFSDIIKFYNISYIMDYLRLGLSSGITLYDSLIILEDSIENDIYKEAIKNSIESMEKGVQFSQTLKNNDLFTKFTLRVTEIGEFTGSMEEEFKILADLYYKKVNDMALMIPKIFQTGALLISGFLMGLIIIGIMGPIYDLIGKL